MNNYSGILEILDTHGIQYQEFPNYIKCVAGWRGGDSINSVTIYPEGLVIDHVTDEKFNYNTLVGRILGVTENEKIEEYLSNKNINFNNINNQITEPLIKSSKYQDKTFLDRLDKSDNAQKYWLNRGINIDILREFGGGVYKNRYYFPIYDENGVNLVGLNSRDLTGKSECKYRLKGVKKEFLYPLFINKQDIINNGEVYLVEGVGCALKLFSCGIRNIIVLFGCECSYTIINWLLKRNSIKIFICTDNDSAGVEASSKIYSRLRKYFDNNQLKIKLPIKKDFGEMSQEEILNWKYNG